MLAPRTIDRVEIGRRVEPREKSGSPVHDNMFMTERPRPCIAENGGNVKRDGPEKTHKLPERIRDLLSSMGLSAEFRPVPDGDPGGWGKYRFVRADGSEPPYPVLLFEHKTKPVQEAKRQVSNLFHCVALFSLRSGYHLFLKSDSSSLPFTLDSADACEQAGTALSASRRRAASRE